MIKNNFSIYINGKEVKAVKLISYHDKNGRDCLKLNSNLKIVSFEQDEHNVVSIENRHDKIMYAGKYSKELNIDRIDIISIKGLDFANAVYIRFAEDGGIYKLNSFDYIIRDMEKIME